MLIPDELVALQSPTKPSWIVLQPPRLGWKLTPKALKKRFSRSADPHDIQTNAAKDFPASYSSRNIQKPFRARRTSRKPWQMNGF